MMDTLRFLGFSAFEISTSRGVKILIDPYISKNEVAPCGIGDLSGTNLILVSHASPTHLGDAAVIAKRFNASVICGKDVKRHLLEEGVHSKFLIETAWGLTVEAVGIRVRPVESKHYSAIQSKDGSLMTGLPLGFLIDLESGTRIYNASDSILFSDMKLIGELYQPDIGLLNVSVVNTVEEASNFLTGEMTPYEATLAAQWLRLKYAVACHYINPDCEDAQLFVRILESIALNKRGVPKAIALRPGEEFRYEPPRLEEL